MSGLTKESRADESLREASLGRKGQDGLCRALRDRARQLRGERLAVALFKGERALGQLGPFSNHVPAPALVFVAQGQSLGEGRTVGAKDGPDFRQCGWIRFHNAIKRTR